MKSVVLFSGGLDSTTALAMAIARGDEVYPLTISYGQRHRVEIEKARRTLDRYRLADRAREISFDLSFLHSSALTDRSLAVPRHSVDAIPVTYVPARNLIFLSLAAAYAEDIGAERIIIGVNAVDFSGYPDCRPAFIEAFERAVRSGTKAGDRLAVEAPLIALSKKEIVELGVGLGVDHALTHSCYDPAPDGAACGTCDSCRLRIKGFAEAGIGDPARYVAR
ncbi:MAG TPA: 7-cyano-7-deazaguanine synthase QueC [bacterium]|nr:7-cyano-7-deazaguanine synthase QueC [bacterium]